MTEGKKPPKKTMKIIIDSNALFLSLKFKIDIFEELGKLLKATYEPILLSPVYDEMRRLATEGSPKVRKDAAYALRMSRKCRIVKVQDEGTSPDDAIVKAAKDYGYMVFTNDMSLRKRLRNINVPVIYVRQKSRLEIDGRL